jgi:hypothetical protein
MHRNIHRTPWQRGGTTSATNLDTLCCRHHHAKHETGWTPNRLPDGTINWTSPTGHHYTEPPATYPIDSENGLAPPGLRSDSPID